MSVKKLTSSSFHITADSERDIDTEEPTEDLTGENEASEILHRFHESIDVLITGHQHRDIATVKYETAVIQPVHVQHK